jgi:hypothetical protein
MLVGSKTMITKKEERAEVVTTRLSTNNSSNKVDHPKWEAKASPLVFKDSNSNSSSSSNSKLEESSLPHRVADGPTKPLAVDGAEALHNPVDGKEVKRPSLHTERKKRG